MTPQAGPIPVKFKDKEEAFLRDLHDQTGLPIVELVRRSVRHLRNSVESASSKEACSHLILQLHA